MIFFAVGKSSHWVVSWCVCPQKALMSGSMYVVSDIVLLGATVSVSISDSRAVCSEGCSVWHPVFRDAVSFPLIYFHESSTLWSSLCGFSCTLCFFHNNMYSLVMFTTTQFYLQESILFYLQDSLKFTKWIFECILLLRNVFSFIYYRYKQLHY